MSELTWQKSSFSGEPHQNCIELASAPTALHFRESDDPTTVLTVTAGATRALLARLKAGGLDGLGRL